MRDFVRLGWLIGVFFLTLISCGGGGDNGCGPTTADIKPGMVIEVIDVSNTPISGPMVGLMINGKASDLVYTRNPSPGVYSLGFETEPGEYKVTVSKAGYKTVTEQYDIKASSDCARTRPTFQLRLLIA